MNAKKGTLFRYKKDSLTLEEALQQCGDILQGGIALLYAINGCQFAKVKKLNSGNSLIGLGADSKEKTLSINDFVDPYIFEARIFNPDCELRWLHESNGKGQASLICEQSDLLQDIATVWQKNTALEYLESLDHSYLLWGEQTDKEAREGWQKISSARIGILTIPLNNKITEKQRVYLKTQEYIAEINSKKQDSNGNVAVVEERLIALKVQ